MMEYSQLLQLSKNAAKTEPGKDFSLNNKTFSYDAMNETLRNELKELAGTYRDYRENKNTVFSLIEETIDDVLPAKVMDRYSQFAEIKTFAQGDKPIFTQRYSEASRRRAQQFIGKVGLAGLYEVFRLDGKSYEVPTNALGGAAQIGFEEFLDGRVDWPELTNIVMEGLDVCIYEEIAKQLHGAAMVLKAATTNKTANNYVEGNGFLEASMDQLLGVTDSYGHSTIYCTFEFAAHMIPSDARMSNDMKNALWNRGYLGNYKGHNVIILPQSYADETNQQKVIDPSMAFIIPTGAEKPVKVAFEGNTIVDDYTNYDRSKEIQVYKKVGVRAIFNNSIGIYKDTSLTY